MKDICNKAEKKDVPFKQWDWPLELHCHRQGKKVAIAIFGEEIFQNCLKDLKRVESPEYKETLDFILALEGQPYRDNISESILSDIRELCRKYGLEKAVWQVWRERKDNGDICASKFKLEHFIPCPES